MTTETKISKAGCIGVAIVLAATAAVLLIITCSDKIPLNRAGVRNLLAQQVIEPIDHGAGYVLEIPGMHAVREWDITWTASKDTLQIRASDQYTTTVDISVIYRIEPGRAHEVALHFADEKRIEDRVRTTLNKYANEVLAQMSTEDFYDTGKRVKKAQEAQKAMHEQLKPAGIEIKYVLLRNIVYDPKFEQQLLQKQLAGQRTELETRKAQLAAEQTITELIRRNNDVLVTKIQEGTRQEIENLKADTDLKVTETLQSARLEAATIVAQAEAYRRKKISEADLLKATASATGTELMSRAYGRAGARHYFARKALENIKLGDIELNSNLFNPLDSTRLLQGLGWEALPVSRPEKSRP